MKVLLYYIHYPKDWLQIKALTKPQLLTLKLHYQNGKE